MINSLKNQVVKIAGFPIKSRGDCELLSHLILEVTDEFINYNTLRRLYGLVKPVTPRRQTLDVLARYVGYDDFAQFCMVDRSENDWEEMFKLHVLQATNNIDAIIDLLTSEPQNVESLQQQLSVWRELILDRRFDAIIKLLDSDVYNPLNYSYTHQLDFAYSVSLLLRKFKEEDIAEIIRHPAFIEGVFLRLVDYNSLNSYYGEWSNYLTLQKRSPQLRTFLICLKAWKNFLNGKSAKPHKPEWLLFDDCPPVLYGRIFSTCLLGQGMKGFDELWQEMERISSNSNRTKKGLFHEMLTLALLVPDYPYSKWLSEQVVIKRDRLEPFEFHDFQCYKLLQAQVALFEGDKIKARRSFTQVRKEEFLMNYREMILFPYVRIEHEIFNSSTRYPRKLCQRFGRLGHQWIGESLWMQYFKLNIHPN